MRYSSSAGAFLATVVLGLTVMGSLPAAQSATAITIVGQNGSLSFSPNPAPVNQGESLLWRNNDFATHRIVLDDGSLDTGNIAPGASSSILTLATSGGNYHCTIHPSMVGTITPAVPTLPRQFMLLLLLTLVGLGYVRLRRQSAR